MSTPGDPPNCYSLKIVLANHKDYSIMGYKLGYHILVLPNQVLHINSVLTNEVLLYVHNQILMIDCLGSAGSFAKFVKIKSREN